MIPCYVLKCDIRQFFASIDQDILLTLLSRHIRDHDIFDLLTIVVTSFAHDGVGIGIPLGNLTSQIFGNIYLDILDQYMRHTLHIGEYIRYADDFVIFSRDRVFLEQVLSDIALFVSTYLHLILHPDKIEIRSIYAGVDFLGWHIFPHYRVLRAQSRRRMMARLDRSFETDIEDFDPIIQSYLSLLSHGNTWKIEQEIRQRYGYIFDYPSI
jgi:RNA-directed DNA polymerase